jgi:hypothetical protein
MNNKNELSCNTDSINTKIRQNLPAPDDTQRNKRLDSFLRLKLSVKCQLSAEKAKNTPIVRKP